MLPPIRLFEDPNNPRTQFPEHEVEELAEDIRQYGILQPIVVHPVNAAGRYQIHFGAKRWRAAQLAGLDDVPVVVRDAPADPYTQVAENQKRHGLTPLDLARFIRRRVDAGDSNATVARRLGMNLTTVAHHLALLELPPDLDEAMKSGRITSPRTLHELSKLHAEQPEQVNALMTSGAEITRTAVSALRDAASERGGRAPAIANKRVAQANVACDRLERVLSRIQPSNQVALPELIALRVRVEAITRTWLQGSDRQTPAQSGP
jgi:ParB family chromosome partitioning protein